MSVVGLTFGIGANAIRPTVASAASAATSDTTRAGGRERSYHANAAAGGGARTPETRGGARPPARRTTRAATSSHQLPLEHVRSLLRRQRPRGAAEHARHVGGEVPAAGEHLGGWAVGDHVAAAHEYDALGEGRRELGVVRRHEDRHAIGRQPL